MSIIHHENIHHENQLATEPIKVDPARHGLFALSPALSLGLTRPIFHRGSGNKWQNEHTPIQRRRAHVIEEEVHTHSNYFFPSRPCSPPHELFDPPRQLRALVACKANIARPESLSNESRKTPRTERLGRPTRDEREFLD